jgi:hypothetical protein
MPSRRPFGVTLLMLLVFLLGALTVIAGIFTLFARNDIATLSNVSSSTVFWSALISIAFGVIYLLVASGLGRGSSMSRFLVALVTVLNLIGNLWLAFILNGSQRWQSLTAVLVGVLVLVLLYNRSASEFFRSN